MPTNQTINSIPRTPTIRNTSKTNLYNQRCHSLLLHGTKKLPQIIITKMSSLIRMHALELRNLTETYNTQISPTLLNETHYKIKCKFKSFTKKISYNP